MLNNIDNYGVYAQLLNHEMTINTNDLTAENIDDHYKWILNIFRDAIETDFVQRTFINIKFGDKGPIQLSLFDYWINLIMWDLIVKGGMKIEPKHIVFDNAITQKTIKKFIDKFFIEEKRKSIPNIVMNKTIDNMLFKFCSADEFSMYLCNTVNLEDFIKLMRTDPEFNDDLLHAKLGDYALADVKNEGQNRANRMIEKIVKSDHCLADFFRAGQGVNPKQFKEVAVNLGTKPDGKGGVFPYIVDTNFLTGGVNDPISFFIEESTGRIAQIIVEGNVSDSGYFARLLGLNNIDTIIHPDPNYICDSHNFQEVEVPDNSTGEEILRRYVDRYYRLDPHGMEYLLKNEDIVNLLGKKLYFRSPMTCASLAEGHGVCYRCYGDLAYTNNDINIGRIAGEEVSSKLTQRMLSAKHLLESAVKKLEWSNEDMFNKLFDIDYDTISLVDEDFGKGWILTIDPESIQPIDEYDVNDEDSITNYRYNEFINSFDILTPNGDTYGIHTENSENMYISADLNEAIRNKAYEYDGKLAINLSDLSDCDLFVMEIQNDELSAALKDIKSIIDKIASIKDLDRHQWLMKLNETFMKAGLDLMSVHGEVILANQLRNANNILEKPEWEYPNEPYQMLSLSQSLTNNPSIIISLSYQRISKLLINPLTYRKHKPSFMDLFFMKNPQQYLNNQDALVKSIDDGYEEKDKKQVIRFLEQDNSDDDDNEILEKINKVK